MTALFVRYAEVWEMKNKYNDYVNTVKEYLRSYNYFKIMIANLEEDKKDKLHILTEYSVLISKYGGMPGGGSGELNQTESAASQRMKLEEELKNIELNLNALYSVINKIDRALSALNYIEKTIITRHYFENKGWEDIGIELQYTGKTVSSRAKKGVSDMAFMIFGAAARPKQLSFCFFKAVDNL